MTTELGLRPRLRSLHTTFLEAVELGNCVLEGEGFAAWTHPDGPRVWHLTRDQYTFKLAQYMADQAHPGLLHTKAHGIAGQTYDSWTLYGFTSEPCRADDKAAQLLSVLAADIEKSLTSAGEQGRCIAEFKRQLADFDLLFPDDRLRLQEALDLCIRWNSSNSIGADLGLHRPGSFVATADGRVVLHPTLAWDRPF